jgi:hypothetical protein
MFAGTDSPDIKTGPEIRAVPTNNKIPATTIASASPLNNKANLSSTVSLSPIMRCYMSYYNLIDSPVCMYLLHVWEQYMMWMIISPMITFFTNQKSQNVRTI